jgi:hypothetical protein
VATAPAKKKESEDNSKRLAVLFYKLNADDVSAAVCGKLLQVSVHFFRHTTTLRRIFTLKPRVDGPAV